jgi:para-nitrobenzyl esterase
MPVYLYRFDYVPEERRRQAAGASHASDVPFVFDTLDVVEGRFSAADRAQARLVGDYWTGFARRGDPNGEGRPPWPAYAGDSVAFNLGADAAAPRALDARALDAIAAAHDGP